MANNLDDLPEDERQLATDLNLDLIENYGIVKKLWGDGERCSRFFLTYGFEVSYKRTKDGVIEKLNNDGNEENEEDEEEYEHIRTDKEEDEFYDKRCEMAEAIAKKIGGNVIALPYPCCWNESLEKDFMIGIPIYEFTFKKRDNFSKYIHEKYLDTSDATLPQTYNIQQETLDKIIKYELLEDDAFLPFGGFNHISLKKDIKRLHKQKDRKLVWKMVPDECYGACG